MFVGVLTTCHTQYTWHRSIYFFYLIEQHSKFLLHTLEVLYIWTLYDSTNINTITEFVPNCLYHVSGDGFNGSSDSYLQFQDICGKRRSINLILDVTPQKEITWGCIWRTRWHVVKIPTIISNNRVLLSETAIILMTITTVIYVITRTYLFRDEWLLVLSINYPNAMKPASFIVSS